MNDKIRKNLMDLTNKKISNIFIEDWKNKITIIFSNGSMLEFKFLDYEGFSIYLNTDNINDDED